MNEKTFSRGKSILFSLCFVAVLLLLLEGLSFSVVRLIWHPFPPKPKLVDNPFHPVLGWTHRPNAQILVNAKCNDRETFIEVNKDGYSITPLQFEKADLRIVVTGSSTMFGVGSRSNDTTVPSLLERYIYEKMGIRAEVHNIAGRGYRSFQEFLSLSQWLASHEAVLMDQEPLLVLSVSGHSDVIWGYYEPEAQYALGSKSLLLTKARLVRRAERGELIIENVVSTLRRRSNTIDLLSRLANLLRKSTSKVQKSSMVANASNELPLNNVSNRVRLALANYAAINAVAETYGASFIMMLEPNAFNKKSLTPEEAACLAQLPELEGRRQYHAAFNKFWQQAPKNFPYVDLSTAFANNTQSTFLDSAHYNDLGATVLSEAIYNIISPKISAILKNGSRRKAYIEAQ